MWLIDKLLGYYRKYNDPETGELVKLKKTKFKFLKSKFSQPKAKVITKVKNYKNTDKRDAHIDEHNETVKFVTSRLARQTYVRYAPKNYRIADIKNNTVYNRFWKTATTYINTVPERKPAEPSKHKLRFKGACILTAVAFSLGSVLMDLLKIFQGEMEIYDKIVLWLSNLVPGTAFALLLFFGLIRIFQYNKSAESALESISLAVVNVILMPKTLDFLLRYSSALDGTQQIPEIIFAYIVLAAHLIMAYMIVANSTLSELILKVIKIAHSGTPVKIADKKMMEENEIAEAHSIKVAILPILAVGLSVTTLVFINYADVFLYITTGFAVIAALVKAIAFKKFRVEMYEATSASGKVTEYVENYKAETRFDNM